MRLTRIDVDALRGDYTRRDAPSAGAMAVSRRQILKMAGAVTIGGGPAVGAVESLGAGIEVREGRGRVAFLLDGRERWVIDTRWFAGSPRLTVDREGGVVSLRLRGARFPGTDMPADLTAQLQKGIAGWRMTLRMALTGFSAAMSAEKFLSERAPMRSSVRLHGRALGLDPSFQLKLQGDAQAEFRPDWTLRFAGRSIALLTTPTGSIAAGNALLGLLQPSHPTAVRRMAGQRSRVTFQRRESHWDLGALIPTHLAASGTTPGGDLTGTFDSIHLELAEGRAGDSALVAESTGDRAALHFKPDGSFTDMDDQPFRYPLQNVRFVRSLARRSSEFALVARFPTEPVWLRTPHLALEVGDGPGASLFEATGKGARVQVTYAPALLRIVVPVEGAITEPTRAQEGTQLRHVHSRIRRARKPDIAHLRTHPTEKDFHELAVSNLVVSILRPQDLLVLKLEYENFAIQVGGDPPRLVPTSGQGGLLIAHFPPQHIQEQAFDTASGENPGGPGSVRTLIAGESRLAFFIPNRVKSIPYQIDALLNWNGFIPNIAVNAYTGPGGAPTPAAPAADQTSIEAPYRLVMSPNELSGWKHGRALEDTTFSGVSELWHTRLGVAAGGDVNETDATNRTLRAVWSPDYTSGDAPSHYGSTSPPDTVDQFRPTLDQHDRDNIVRLSSDFSLTGDSYTPLPVAVERLMLSSLGAWMSVHGVWAPVPGIPDLDVAAWRHQMTMGRDQYVRVVYRGYMYPFGNKAAYIKVSERKFVQPPTGGPQSEAVLLQRSFVAIRQPERTYIDGDYPAGWSEAKGGRKMPFKTLRIKTLVTPDLRDPNASTDPNSGSITVQLTPKGGGPRQAVQLGQDGFWPTYNGPNGPADVIWHVEAVDANGVLVEFATPLAFVSSDISVPPSSGTYRGVYVDSNLDVLRAVQGVYASDPRHTMQMSGQKIAMAPKSSIPSPSNGQISDTGLETQSIDFNVDVVDSAIALPLDVPWFFPRLDQSQVIVQAAKHLLGTNDPKPVTFNPQYLDHGLDTSLNKGQIYLDMAESLSLRFGRAADGSLVTQGVGLPNVDLQSISALFGATGSAGADLANGQFDPAKIFGPILDAKILGFFTLKDIIGIINDITGPGADGLPNLGKLPQLVTQNVPATPSIPESVHVSYAWKTPIKSFLILVDHNIGTGAPARLQLTADITLPVPKSSSPLPEPTYKIEGGLYDLSLDFGVIGLPFNKLVFTIESGKKLTVVCDVGDLLFERFLKFVNAIRDFMKNFEDPPYLDVAEDHVEAGYTLTIPDITCGALSLQNISLGAALTIPFFGEPIHMSFNFATRENPFILTVYIFGGGGFLMIGMGPQGMTTLEASLEAGVNFALNLGVASGEVRAMVGIYMKWDLTAGTGSLTGFVDIQGEVDVLGLISASIDIYISLTYEFATKKLAGEASIKVDVHVLFFHTTVTLGPVRKEFTGSSDARLEAHLVGHAAAPAPVPVASVISKPDWTAYCGAFV